MDFTNTDNKLRVRGRIDRKVYDTDRLGDTWGDWHSLSDSEKLSRLRSVEPDETETVHNVTTDQMHEYFVDNLNPTDTSPQANVAASWVALGDDSSAGTDSSDTDLNNRVFEKEVTDHSDNGKELFTSTFVGASEGNGPTYNEIGLFTGDPTNLANDDVFMLNHATFTGVTKDDSKTITFDVRLTFSDT